MPNRIIKESVCTSETLDQLNWFEEVFFYRLIVNCDDFGRFDARPAVLKARLFPLKERITLRDVSNALSKLADIGIVRLYECDSKPYLYLPTWRVHQTTRATKSKFPAPDENMNSNEFNCNQTNSDAPDIRYSIFDNRKPINDNRERDRAREEADPGLAKVMTLYMDRVQAMPSTTCIDYLKSYTAELGADVVCHAIEKALDDNKRSWSYIQGILRRYSAEGLKSMEAVQAAEAEFERAKERNASRPQQQQPSERKSFSEIIAERSGMK